MLPGIIGKIELIKSVHGYVEILMNIMSRVACYCNGKFSPFFFFEGLSNDKSVQEMCHSPIDFSYASAAE